MKGKIRSWWSKERGAATVSVFILSMPLIVGSFGFGFDGVRALYFKNYIQNRADLAVQNAVASNSSTLENGGILLGSLSVNDVYDNYNKNTSTYRSPSTLICPTSPTSAEGCSGEAKFVGSPASINCLNLSVGGQYGLRFDVRENINTVFLRILGIKKLNLGLVSAVSLIRPDCR